MAKDILGTWFIWVVVFQGVRRSILFLICGTQGIVVYDFLAKGCGMFEVFLEVDAIIA